MKQFTWYVNILGQVQIYEGDINEKLIIDALSLEEAMKDPSIEHKHYRTEYIKHHKGIRGFFSNEMREVRVLDHITKEYRPSIKYWIPTECADAFFTLINNPTYSYGYSGVTTVDVSEFLD